MDRPFLCYDYGADLPALPKDSRTEIVTFGSFNANEKLTNSTLKLWADALRDLGECRLLIKLNYSPGERLLHEIEQHFSPNVMVEFLSSVASHSEHLQRISQVDIALDSFPYNGTTTTIECLLMGTPVVTLAGESHRSRVSGSILTATGNNKWIASSPEEFKSIVHKLKATTPTRQQVRESLTNSPLMDTKDYATKFGKLINQVLSD